MNSKLPLLTVHEGAAIRAREVGSTRDAVSLRRREASLVRGGLQIKRASDALAAMLARHEETTEPLEVSFRQLVGPIPVNDLTHSVYPYPGRLLRQIPRFFLHCEQLIGSDDVVLDPFCGSGTVLVEARAAQIHGWGMDVNPFARLLSTVKTTPLPVEMTITALQAVLASAKAYRRATMPDVVNIHHWFSPSAQSALGRLFRAIDSISSSPEVTRFLLLTLALAADRSSLRDHRIPVPVRHRDWEKRSADFANTHVWATFQEMGASLAERLAAIPDDGVVSVVDGADALSAKELFDSRLATTINAPRLILTSPPYGAAQKYIRSSELALGWTGLAGPGDLAKLERNSIGREHLRLNELEAIDVPSQAITRDIARIQQTDPRRAAIYAHYFREMDVALRSCSRVLAPGGAMVVVAGSNVVAGLQVPTHQHLRDLALRHGLAHVLELRDQIRGRVLLTKRANAGSPLHSETVHVFRKPAS